jgi:hypothetical protein
MGFGFNLLFIFIILPAVAIICLILLFTNRKLLLYFIAIFFGGLIILSFLVQGLHFMTSKKVLDKDDYYGEYVIDRSFFKGKQADWQYNNFRFEITEDDSMHFYITNHDKIITTINGKIRMRGGHSDLIKINFPRNSHHILSGQPGIYRSTWSFYLVLKSPKFHNMYFIKDSWEPID